MASELISNNDALNNQIQHSNSIDRGDVDFEYGNQGDSPLSHLSANLSESVGATTEIVSAMSNIQSGRDLLNTGFGLLPPGLGTAPCFVDLAAGITAYAVSPERNAVSNQDAAILNAMGKPFVDAFSLLGDVLLPGEDGSIADQLEGFFSEIGDSLSNPLLLFLGTQQSLLGNSFDSMMSQFNTGEQGSFFNDFRNNVLAALQKLFLGPDAEGNLLGIFIYAFEYGIPSIDAELYALRKLKKLSLEISEEASNAPIQINLQLPNAAAVLNLCEAEEALRIAYEKLAKNDQLDRSMLAYAKQQVCGAKSIIYDGSFSADFLKSHAANFVGLGGPNSSVSFKAQDISIGKMLPAATFKAKIDVILRLAQQVKNQDDQIVILYGNIVKAVDNIKSMTNVHIGKLLAPLILFVKNAVSGVRRDLELTGTGVDKLPEFTYNKPIYDSTGNQIGVESVRTTDVSKYQEMMADYITAKYGVMPESELRKRVDLEVQKYYLSYSDKRYDVWSYMSSQTAAYMWLTVLCKVLELMPATFGFIDRVLSGQSAVMRVIETVVERFNVANCAGETDPTRGGTRVIAHVNDLIRAAQNRFNGQPGAQLEIARATKELRRAISDRQKFLVCMKQHMFFGLDQFMAVFSAISNSVALYQNLKQILNQISGLKNIIANLSINDLFGDASAIGLIIKGIKCLVASCDSPVLSTLATEVIERIEPEVQEAESKNTTMKKFDGAPRVAAKIANNQRLVKILKLVESVNKILGMNFDALCTDDEKAKRQNMSENIADSRIPVNASSSTFYQYDGQRNQAKAFSSTVSQNP